MKEEMTTALEEFVRQRSGKGLVVAQVTLVDLNEMTIDCEDGEGNEYLDVRLNAVPGRSGVLPIPALNASVLILDLGITQQDYVMIQAGQIERWILNVDDNTEVQVDEDFIYLGDSAKQSAVLGEKLNDNLGLLIGAIGDLRSALSTFCTTQGAVSTGTLAPLAPGYTTLAAELTNVQTELSNTQNLLEDHLSEIVRLK